MGMEMTSKVCLFLPLRPGSICRMPNNSMLVVCLGAEGINLWLFVWRQVASTCGCLSGGRWHQPWLFVGSRWHQPPFACVL